MSTLQEQNKAIARRYYEEVVNGGKATVIDELFAADHVNHLPGSPEPIRGPEGEKQLDTMFRKAFPDARLTVEDMVAEGDKVASRLTYRGSHQGEFQGIPPTGKPFTMMGMHVVRIVGGKIVEAWPMPDFLGLMQQLGVVPAPGQSGG